MIGRSERPLAAEKQKAANLESACAAYQRQIADLNAENAGPERALDDARAAHGATMAELRIRTQQRDTLVKSNRKLLLRAQQAESTRNGVLFMTGGLALITALKKAR